VSAAKPPTPNGRRWTVDPASSNGTGGKVRNDTAGRLIVLGYITAIAMPLLGFIIGIVVATRWTKGTSRHGRWIILLSVVGSILWILVFTSGLFATPNNDLGGY
jgi:hypothetical protein